MNQIDGVSNKVSSLCGSVWEKAQRRDNTTAWPLEFGPGGSCALVLTLMPDTSISPCMSLVSFQLLPQC